MSRTRGAAITFYTVTSIGPVLLIIVAIVGLVLARMPRAAPDRWVNVERRRLRWLC